MAISEVYEMKKKKNMYTNLGLITQVGLNMIIPIIAGLYLGIYLDRKFNRDMLFSLIFIILGSITGFLNLLKLADRSKGDKNKK